MLFSPRITTYSRAYECGYPTLLGTRPSLLSPRLLAIFIVFVLFDIELVLSLPLLLFVDVAPWAVSFFLLFVFFLLIFFYLESSLGLLI